MDEERGEINVCERGYSMDSTKSRWVYQVEDEDASDIEDFDADLRLRGRRNGAPVQLLDSDEEDDGTTEQRLIRTGPRVDSFNVEALDVPGAHRNDYELKFQMEKHLIFLCVCARVARSSA
ncbi:potassium transporter 7-like [Lotus japonicus]|uniref:potassium transporter 7-like n=1 Tax=Lotus japonicus TaxID=34305 RepID=UPI00258E3FC3|nr:potassium transporter 7-like [Lotus japonicus]